MDLRVVAVCVTCVVWMGSTGNALAYVNPGVQALAGSQAETEAVVDAMGTPLATGPFTVPGNYYRERAADVVFKAIQAINPTYVNAGAVTAEAEATEVAAGLFPSLTKGMALSKVLRTRAIPGIGTGLVLADIALGVRHWYLEKRAPQITSGSVARVDLMYTGATAVGQCANGGYVMTYCTFGSVPLPPDQFLIQTVLSPSGTTFTTDGLAFGVDQYIDGCRYYSPHPDEYMPVGTVTRITRDWGYYARCHDASGAVVGSTVAAWVMPQGQLQTNRSGPTIPSGEPSIADIKVTADPPPAPATQVDNVLAQLDKPENAVLVDQINWALSNIPPASDPHYDDPSYTPPQPDASTSPANGVYEVPDCAGLQYLDCKTNLTRAGFTDVRQVVVPDWASRDDLAAGETILVQDQGTVHSKDDVIGVATNPDPKPSLRPAPPVYDDDDTQMCDISPGGIGFDPNADHLFNFFDVYDAAFPIAPPGGSPSTFLLWGWTAEADSITGWGGWGYSHIVAKHGWSATDSSQTRLTLSDPQHTYVHQGNGRDAYIGIVKPGQAYWVRTATALRLCVRWVIVQPTEIGSATRRPVPATGPDPVTDQQPSGQGQTGIWTSFGRIEVEVPL